MLSDKNVWSGSVTDVSTADAIVRSVPSAEESIALVSSQYQTRGEYITRSVEFLFVFADDGLPRPPDCEPNDAQQKWGRSASHKFNIQR